MAISTEDMVTTSENQFKELADKLADVDDRMAQGKISEKEAILEMQKFLEVSFKRWSKAKED